MSPLYTLSRRTVLAGIAASTALRPGGAHASVEDRAAVLARRLREMDLPHAPTRLDLLRYEDWSRGGEVRIEAVVRLTWAPGMRTRPIKVQAPDYDAGLDAALLAVHELFADPK